MSFFRILTHLLPRARAWRVTVDKTLRRYLEGLAETGTAVKQHVDLVWLDIFPETTREIPAWEQRFGLPNTVLTEAQRRDRLLAAWRAVGGQSPRYIQDTLQAAGFNVYVHEWWVPGSGNPPTVRNPFTYLNDGLQELQYLSCDGNADMQDGDLAVAMDGATIQPSGYPLINKTLVPTSTIIGDGSELMQDGAQDAQDGGLITVYGRQLYPLPLDADTWPYFLYIGGETFPNHAEVPSSRKNEFEDLCLKICPTQNWLGMLIDYV